MFSDQLFIEFPVKTTNNMSGGKKKTKTQGWEEAGAEFYQESYLTDAELEDIQKDPARLATLLPSKQTRAGKS